ncbi:GNAT family N-acetyltransferase [Geoglobus acetivorans]|uniref:N-acetyltransferase domain-containing protein n=1 Tax=Geoglobus acetivorans TaxID=565033 RepID=A0A0A7GJC8_GEOAI|nr:hypothetical protein GACE_2002 [Geoglobus acetivorans]
MQKKMLTPKGRVIRIRPLNENDLDSLIKMYTTLSDSTLKYMRAEKFTEDEVREMFRKVDFERVYSIVAEERDFGIVGELRIIMHETGSGEIGFVVHDEFQYQGIGQSLVREAIEFARKEGIKKLIAFINENNACSIHIFRKYGFVVERRFGPEYHLMGKEEAVLKLALRLD